MKVLNDSILILNESYWLHKVPEYQISIHLKTCLETIMFSDADVTKKPCNAF